MKVHIDKIINTLDSAKMPDSDNRSGQAQQLKVTIAKATAIGKGAMALSIAAALSACGPFQQNPVEKYPLTNQYAVPADSKIPNQNQNQNQKPSAETGNPSADLNKPDLVPAAAAAGERSEAMDAGMDKNIKLHQLFLISGFDNKTFIVGKKGTSTFKVRTLNPSLGLDTKIKDPVGDMSWTKKAEKTIDGGTEQEYELTYTPAADLLPDGQAGTLVKFSIEFLATAGGDSSLAAALGELGEQNQVEHTFFVLNKDQAKAAPTLTVKGLTSNSISESEEKQFQIEIKNLKVKDPKDLKLHVIYRPETAFTSSGYAERDGSKYIITLNEVPEVSGSRYTYDVKLSSQGHDLPYDLRRDLSANKNEKKVHFRVSFQAEGLNGLVTNEVDQSFSIEMNSINPDAASAAPAEQ